MKKEIIKDLKDAIKNKDFNLIKKILEYVAEKNENSGLKPDENLKLMKKIAKEVGEIYIFETSETDWSWASNYCPECGRELGRPSREFVRFWVNGDNFWEEIPFFAYTTEWVKPECSCMLEDE